MLSSKRAILGFVLWAAAAGSAAHAQSTAAIQGNVTDQSGGAVPRAVVTVTNEATGEQRATLTDNNGQYLVPSLPVGRHSVNVAAPGLQTTTARGLVLEVGRTVQQNLQMPVATTTESVQVTAQPPVIDSATVSVGTVINQNTVQEIPLNGRHFVDLGLLTPGTVTPPQNGFLTAPLRGQGSFALNTAGNREDTVNFMINGINLNDMVQNQITFQPSIATVQEFKFDNSTYSAEYGRNSGAITNIATRSGTNEYHGELFEFLRNNDLDARNYFNRRGVLQSPFKRNQFGADGGGPIWKDHTFFYLSYEGLRQRQGLTINQTVLTPDQRAQGLAIGNPTVVKLLPLIPVPNSGNSLFVGSATAPVNIDQGTANISQTFGKDDRLNFYYAFQSDLRQEPTLSGNNIPDFGDTRQSHRQIMTIVETHVFSPNLVNEARLGYNRIHITLTPNAALNPADFGMNVGVNTAIGIPQTVIHDINLNFGGPSMLPQGRGDYTAVVSDTASYVRSNHSLKIGGEYRRFNNNNFQLDTGTFEFPNVTSFLNGQATTFAINSLPNSSRIYTNAIGAFVQDNWRVMPSLTLELGLRYDWFGTPTEAQNRFVVFDPAQNALIQVGAGMGLSEAYRQNTQNVQPRAGFAWDVFGSGRTVVRGAYAILADQPVTNMVLTLAANPPFAAPVSFNGPGTVTFANAITAAHGAGSLAPNTVNHGFHNGYVQSWNFNIQHELTNDLGIMAGYFGNKGTHLRSLQNLNQFLAEGTTARQYAALSATSPIEPGVRLGNIYSVESSGNSSYNALWLTATKRFGRGLQFQTSYTWSKALDYSSLSSISVPVFQDSFNIRGDRGLSDFDARHRFVLSGIYSLPFRGNRAVEGWSFAVISQLQSGNPVNIVLPSGSITGVPNTVRPDLLGSVPTGIGSAPNGNPQYFPSAACTTPVAGCLFLMKNGFGSLGRNVVIGPGFADVDFSLFKDTRVTERTKIQFRSDFFNILNHPNFGQPNRFVSMAAGNTFGQITSTRFPVGDAGSSRQIQLALKFMF